MRRLYFAFALCALLCAQTTFAYTNPGSPDGYVNDFAGVLSSDTELLLEQELAAFEASTTNQIAVALIANMDGDYIENYAVKLFEDWKIGTKENDNGVLLLLAMQEREMRIEVGYGLEGALPDSVAANILEDMRSLLRSGNTDAAVLQGTRAIEAATKGEYVSTADTSPTAASFFTENIEWLFFSAMFGLQWLAAILARSKSWWAGGILGLGAGLVVGGLFIHTLLYTALLTSILGALGLLFDYVVSKTYKFHASQGSAQPWWIGGNTIGGGRSSGGFGGFGGGSSGGGGASGRW